MAANNNNNSAAPQFFKVFLPDQSSQHLLIPPSFVKKFIEIIPRKIDLKDPRGKLWNVDVKQVGNNLFMQNGWRDFVTHYALEYGDFLVFTWTMKSIFHVKLFGKNGCLKKIVSAAAIDVVDEISTPCTKKEEIDEISTPCATKEDESVVLYVDNGRFPRACKRTSAGSVNRPQNKSRKLDGVKGEKCEMFDEKPSVRNTPHFKVIIKKSYRFAMHIPLVALKKSGIKFTETVVLRDHNNKGWPVGLSLRKDGRTHLSAGWANFRNHMKLKKGDKCLFEFILERGSSICRELKVQVFHSQPSKRRRVCIHADSLSGSSRDSL